MEGWDTKQNDDNQRTPDFYELWSRKFDIQEAKLKWKIPFKIDAEL